MKRIIFLLAGLQLVFGISGFAQGFQIQGSWKFMVGDKKEFSNPTFNDAEWNSLLGYENVTYQSAKPVVPYTAKQNYFPANMDEVQVNGWLGEKLDINTKKRLEKVDEDGLLAGYINRPGNHSWIGEHIGKFLEER